MIPGADDDEDDDILCVPPPDAASIRSAFVDGDPLSTMQEPSTSKPKRVVSTCVNINIVNNSVNYYYLTLILIGLYIYTF